MTGSWRLGLALFTLSSCHWIFPYDRSERDGSLDRALDRAPVSDREPALEAARDLRAELAVDRRRADLAPDLVCSVEEDPVSAEQATCAVPGCPACDGLPDPLRDPSPEKCNRLILGEPFTGWPAAWKRSPCSWLKASCGLLRFQFPNDQTGVIWTGISAKPSSTIEVRFRAPSTWWNLRLAAAAAIAAADCNFPTAITEYRVCRVEVDSAGSLLYSNSKWSKSMSVAWSGAWIVLQSRMAGSTHSCHLFVDTLHDSVAETLPSLPPTVPAIVVTAGNNESVAATLDIDWVRVFDP